VADWLSGVSGLQQIQFKNTLAFEMLVMGSCHKYKHLQSDLFTLGC